MLTAAAARAITNKAIYGTTSEHEQLESIMDGIRFQLQLHPKLSSYTSKIPITKNVKAKLMELGFQVSTSIVMGGPTTYNIQW